MSPIDRLTALEGIRRIKAQYFQFLDLKEWDLLKDVFTPDLDADVREATENYDPAQRFSSREAFMTMLRPILTGVPTVHQGYNPCIDFTSDLEAVAVWSMEDYLWFPDGWGNLPARAMHGFGHYHDRYRKVGERWLISAFRLTRVHINYT